MDCANSRIRSTAIWQYQSLHNGSLPDDESAVDDLTSIANGLIIEADINRKVIETAPESLIRYLSLEISNEISLLSLITRTISTTAAHEFSPVCAIVGGMLAQDILKALAAREPPIANFFAFDGNTGGGTAVRMNMP